MKSIYQFVKEFKAKNFPLHVLINNAAVMLVPEKKTEDGFEEHLGINYLGHFLLTNLLLDILKQSGTHSHNARIVNLSSATHYVGELHLHDLQSSCLYSPHGAYAQSKLALVLFSYQLQHLLTLEGSHVTVNVVDPGVVNTDLYQHVCWAVKMVKWMTSWLLLKVLGNPLMVPHHSDLFNKIHLHFHRTFDKGLNFTNMGENKKKHYLKRPNSISPMKLYDIQIQGTLKND
uniref:Dehydrogenase/reductase X-linked n=1 Tax=Laticauda laticaudata TaxID=8630 RepID=A0A8C5SSE0_LATLA